MISLRTVIVLVPNVWCVILFGHSTRICHFPVNLYDKPLTGSLISGLRALNLDFFQFVAV